MIEDYRTVAGAGQAEIEINKSRFISYVHRAETESQANAFIEHIKKKHWDATHNCSAYLVGVHNEHQRADDNGEPSGTAGKPMLEVMKKSGLKDTVIVVTRYFGGIKLGAGGLIRAYGKATSTGLKATGLVDRIAHLQMSLELDYGVQGSVENNLRTYEYMIKEKSFSQAVTMLVLVKIGLEEVSDNKSQIGLLVRRSVRS